LINKKTSCSFVFQNISLGLKRKKEQEIVKILKKKKLNISYLDTILYERRKKTQLELYQQLKSIVH